LAALISFWPTLTDEELQTMLTPEERQEIEAEFARYPNKQAVSIDAMKIIQRHRGWVSDESLRDLGEVLDMTPDELDGVATFYNLVFRKPVGRHIVLICDSVSCWIMGYKKLCHAFTSRLGVDLGGTTADGRFTVLPIVCLGTCDHAPAMMVDNDLHHDLDPDKLDEVLEKYR
jgi:NADH-quinone oxidoreductase subunit E